MAVLFAFFLLTLVLLYAPLFLSLVRFSKARTAAKLFFGLAALACLPSLFAWKDIYLAFFTTARTAGSGWEELGALIVALGVLLVANFLHWLGTRLDKDMGGSER